MANDIDWEEQTDGDPVVRHETVSVKKNMPMLSRYLDSSLLEGVGERDDGEEDAQVAHERDVLVLRGLDNDDALWRRSANSGIGPT